MDLEDSLEFLVKDSRTVVAVEELVVEAAQNWVEAEVAVHKEWNVTDLDTVDTKDESHNKVVEEY